MYKVLLVEDESIIRQGLIFRVNWLVLNCSVPLEAPNGREGLALIESEKPDIVITDVKMPFMDGIEMLEHGSELYHFKSIIVSGYEDFTYARSAIRLGVSDYLLKPVDMEELVLTIKKLCRSIESEQLRGQANKMKKLPHIQYQMIDQGFMETKLKTSSRHVTALLSRIKTDYANKLSLKRIAGEMGISATYLNRKFKEEMFFTFNEFLNRYRIQKAISLLMENQYKIYTISEMTGFREYRYFALVFKKYVGCSPTEFYDIMMEMHPDKQEKDHT